MLGVLISPPKHPGSEKPISSARMTIMLGRESFSLSVCKVKKLKATMEKLISIAPKIIAFFFMILV
jgi:hypothetical protein